MIRRGLMIIMCLMVILTMGGVYATWKYSEMSPQPAEQTVGVSLNVFEYKPEEILPGGDDVTEEVIPGNNHYAVIELVVNGSRYSLNNDRLIHGYVDDSPYVMFSNQKVSGGNLKHILDPSNNTHGLYYCVEKSTDSLYYIYTFSVDELATASGTNVEIMAYRTSVEYTNKWTATVSYLGHALTKRVDDMGASADSQALRYSIDVSTWHMEH